MTRSILKKLLPVLVVAVGGVGAVAVMGVSEARPVPPTFTNPVEQPAPPTGGPGVIEDLPIPRGTGKPQVTTSPGGGCPQCLDEPVSENP